MPLSRRDFFAATAATASATMLANSARAQESSSSSSSNGGSSSGSSGHPDAFPKNPDSDRYRPATKVGAGGTQVGSIFFETPDEQADQTMQAAWDAGVRYFDTSPWYGLGLSERRMGHFLDGQDPESYVVSTKIGRILKPNANTGPIGAWKGRINFGYEYDYSAEGTRRSVEESLQRMGIPKIDMVFIHDLAPSNGDFDRARYEELMQQAIEGAMPELTKMRDEGMIKGWGMGVNDIEPAVTCIEQADPDVTLLATQYHLLKHADAMQQVFPKYAERGASIIIGAPLAAGFLAGKKRYMYGSEIPPEMVQKGATLNRIAGEHGVSPRTAALQFSAAPDVVSSTIPGPRTQQQARENAQSFGEKIPAAFWEDLRSEGILDPEAPTPA